MLLDESYIPDAYPQSANSEITSLQSEDTGTQFYRSNLLSPNQFWENTMHGAPHTETPHNPMVPIVGKWLSIPHLFRWEMALHYRYGTGGTSHCIIDVQEDGTATISIILLYPTSWMLLKSPEVFNSFTVHMNTEDNFEFDFVTSDWRGRKYRSKQSHLRESLISWIKYINWIKYNNENTLSTNWVKVQDGNYIREAREMMAYYKDLTEVND